MAPLDLHVLGTPPAFVLSQDQTLVKIAISVIPHLYTFNSFDLLVFSAFIARWLISSFFLNPNFCHKKLKFLYFTHLFDVLDKNSALFIFQGTFCCLIGDSLVILTHPFTFVNTFFKIFFNFFTLLYFCELLTLFHSSNCAFWQYNLPLACFLLHYLFAPYHTFCIIVKKVYSAGLISPVRNILYNLSYQTNVLKPLSLFIASTKKKSV